MEVREFDKISDKVRKDLQPFVLVPTLRYQRKHESEQSLLNIRNYNDPNCFLYYSTAAYHIFTGKPLAGPETLRRVKKSPELYGSGNRTAHPALGEYKMPMPMSEIGIFENENGVHVNIFR